MGDARVVWVSSWGTTPLRARVGAVAPTPPSGGSSGAGSLTRPSRTGVAVHMTQARAFPPRSTVLSGRRPLYPRFVGLPHAPYHEGYLTGVAERARAGQQVLADLYGRRSLLDRFPQWKDLLACHDGYWPELVGQVGDPWFARFYGPDLFWLDDGSGGYRFEVGEENGGNVMGAKRAAILAGRYEEHPEWGTNPLPGSPFHVWLDVLRELARHRAGSGRQGRVVIVDDASEAADPIRIGDALIAPPYPAPPRVMDHMRDLAGQLGVDWFSLVDERGRLFVEDGVVRVRDRRPGNDVHRVDVLVTIANVESIDPEHAPQRERNARRGAHHYNRVARLAGVAGLVRAWCEGRDGGFVWVNNPTSNFMKSKLAPLFVDDVIRERARRAPLAPSVPTTVFIGRNGRLDADAVAHVGSAPDRFVFKGQMGADGDSIRFGDEMAAEGWGTLVERLRSDPGRFVAQPIRALATARLLYADHPAEERRFDVRQVCLVAGVDGDGMVLPSHQPVVRMAGPGGRLLNIATGGLRSLAVPARVSRVRALAPDEGGLADVDTLLEWSRRGIP